MHSHNPLDFMYYSAPPIIWGTIEMNLAIVCACVPALKPLVVHVVPAFATRPSENNSSSRESGMYKLSKLARSFQRLDAKLTPAARGVGDEEQGRHVGHVEGAPIAALPAVYRQYPVVFEKEGILVTHDVEQKSVRRCEDI